MRDEYVRIDQGSRYHSFLRIRAPHLDHTARLGHIRRRSFQSWLMLCFESAQPDKMSALCECLVNLPSRERTLPVVKSLDIAHLRVRNFLSTMATEMRCTARA